MTHVVLRLHSAEKLYKRITYGNAPRITQTNTCAGDPLDPKANNHYLSYQPALLVLSRSESVSDCSSGSCVSGTLVVLSRKS
jgi:hypothetical protein